MKKVNFLVLVSVLGCLVSPNSFAAGLDEIYRDLVRSDNRGYLPLFVKNREAPKIFEEESLSSDITKPVLIDEQAVKGLEDINLENDRQRRSAERDAAELRWQQALRNVQAGYVSSVELEELNKKEQEDNPQAIEVLAWMFAKGVGVDVDLTKAFNYYKKGVALGIPQAKENAVKVYKAMSAEEKTKLLE